MVSSMVYMSLENLLRMRPRGVVSKKDIGAYRMFASMPLWIVVEAFTLPIARTKEATRMKAPWVKPRAAYTPRNSPMELERNNCAHTGKSSSAE